MLHYFKRLLEWLYSWMQVLLSIFGGRKIYFESCERSVILESSIVGEGGFSQVLMASDARTPKIKYAVKKIIIQSPEEDKSVGLEIYYLKTFAHSSVINFFGAHFETENGLRVAYMLFPLVKNGNLRQRLNQILEGTKPIFSTEKLIRSFIAITSAVNKLHTHSPAYVHRDIKPDNILLDEDDEPLLTDFGSVGIGSIVINTRTDALTVSDDAARLCTLPYRAPELFDPVVGSTVDVRTDVWALGCLFYSYCFGYSPFECAFNQSNIPYVVECSYLRILGKIPRPQGTLTDRENLVLDLSSWMLNQIPNMRPMCTDILARLGLILDTNHGFQSLPTANDIDPCPTEASLLHNKFI